MARRLGEALHFNYVYARANGVLMTPGATAFTRMPWPNLSRPNPARMTPIHGKLMAHFPLVPILTVT
jgi:hypothetical protein